MNWKHEAIDKLKQYEAKKQALRSIPVEISRLEASMKSIRSTTADAIPVKGGGSGREDMVLSNIVHREELKIALEQAQKWVDRVDAGLTVLCADERLILEKLYMKPGRGNMERLCGELMCEQATIYRRRDKALYRFTVCLYGCTET